MYRIYIYRIFTVFTYYMNYMYLLVHIYTYIYMYIYIYLCAYIKFDLLMPSYDLIFLDHESKWGRIGWSLGAPG
jgi:hypothetical protein